MVNNSFIQHSLPQSLIDFFLTQINNFSRRFEAELCFLGEVQLNKMILNRG